MYAHDASTGSKHERARAIVEELLADSANVAVCDMNPEAPEYQSGTPLYIPQGLWLAGLCWMCLVLALMLLRASIALASGDTDAVKAIAGVRSAKEEAAEEAAAGERLVKEAAA